MGVHSSLFRVPIIYECKNNPKNVGKKKSSRPENQISLKYQLAIFTGMFILCPLHISGDETGPPRHQLSPLCLKRTSKSGERGGNLTLNYKYQHLMRYWCSFRAVKVKDNC